MDLVKVVDITAFVAPKISQSRLEVCHFPARGVSFPG